MSDSPRSAHLNRQPLWTQAVLWGLVVVGLGFLLDTVAHRFYNETFSDAWWKERAWENAVEGIFAGIIAYFLLARRERRIERRFHEIAYLNHHIRNALSAIVLSQDVGMEAKQRIGVVRDGSDRIQRCLEKISREDEISDFHETPGKPL